MSHAINRGAEQVLETPVGATSLVNFVNAAGEDHQVTVDNYAAISLVESLVTAITAFATGGQASAVALTGKYNNVTTVASDFDSVKLLTALVGQTQTVKNSGANILSVFPNTSDSINAMAVNLSVDIPVGAVMTFRAITTTVWETIESLYLSGPSTQNGGFEILGADNASNDIVRLINASHGQATILTIEDNGAATGTMVVANDLAYLINNVAMSPLKWVDVAVTASALDSAGNVAVIAGVAGDQYKIRDIILVGGGTNYGSGGDRLIDLTDGTTVWTTIANADIEAAPSASLKWGDAKVPLLTGTSNTASASNAAIRFEYSGGATDHSGTGSINFSVLIEKVA